MGTPIPNHKNEEKGRGAGPVTTYRLTPEEIAALAPAMPIPRSHTKPIGFETDKQPILKQRETEDMSDPKLTKKQYLALRMQGLDRKAIARKHDYTLSHLENYWLKKWGIKDPAQEEVALAEAFSPAPAPAEPKEQPAGLVAFNAEREARSLEELAAQITELKNERDQLREERDDVRKVAEDLEAKIDMFASGVLDREKEIESLRVQLAEQQQANAELDEDRLQLLRTIEIAADGPTVVTDPVKKVDPNNTYRVLAELGVLPQLPSDQVNHPAHYTAGDIEAIDAIEAALTGLSGGQAYNTGAALKYLWRWSRKNGREDLEKARWYINRLLAGLEANAG